MPTPDHFNKLTPVEAECLSLLLEECGEIVHIIGKIQRHGLESSNPDAPEKGTNREQLTHELGDIEAAIEIASKNRLVSMPAVLGASHRKLLNVRKYLHHITILP